MDKKNFLSLLKRYQDGNTTPEEEQMLLNYLESFQAHQEDSWPLELGNSEELKNDILTGILQNIKKDKSSTYINRRFPYSNLFRYAASIVLIAGAFYFFHEMYETPKNGLRNQEVDDSIVLKLENGNTSVITENDNKDIMDSHGNVVGVQSGNTITYGKAKKEPKELVYNELTVPLGKKIRFSIVRWHLYKTQRRKYH